MYFEGRRYQLALIDFLNEYYLSFDFLVGTLARPVDRCCLQYAYAVLEYSRMHKTKGSQPRKVVFVSREESDVKVAISVFSQVFPRSYRHLFRVIEEVSHVAVKDHVEPYTKTSNDEMKQKTDHFGSTSADENDQKYTKPREPESHYHSILPDSIRHSSDAYTSLESGDMQPLLYEKQNELPEEYKATATATNRNNSNELYVSGRLSGDKIDEDKDTSRTEPVIGNTAEHASTCENVNSDKTANHELENTDINNDGKNNCDTIEVCATTSIGKVEQIKPNVTITKDPTELDKQESDEYRLQAVDKLTSNKGTTRHTQIQPYIRNFGGKIDINFVTQDIRDFNSVAIVCPFADTKGKTNDINGNDLMASAIKAAYHVTFSDSAHEKVIQKLRRDRSKRRYATCSISDQEDISQGRAKYIFHVVLPMYSNTKPNSEFRNGLTTAFDALVTKIKKINKRDNNAVRELAFPLFGLSKCLYFTILESCSRKRGLNPLPDNTEL